MKTEKQMIEILGELAHSHPTVIAIDTVGKAFKKIHALYLEEFERILPEKQKPPKRYKQEEDYLTQIKIGWNQCIENIELKIKKLKEDDF